MNLATHYRLAEGVAIRSERFGGLVYRYDNRRLYFLHSRDVADFVSGLDGLRPLQKALEDFLVDRGLPTTAGGTLVKTVAQLEKMGILVPAPADVSKAHTQAHSPGGGQDVQG
jgi:mycofactocin biosynthesis protein MftB